MKTIISTFALSLALCAAAGATAQAQSAASATAPDTVLLSKTIDGNYTVCRYLVKSQNDADYSVRYQISVAKLVPMFDGNTQQLDKLGAFVSNVMNDSLMHVSSAVITGYASPDGPLMLNEKLAKCRAQNFKHYLDTHYNFSTHYAVTERAVADNWTACRAMVAESSIPQKQAVLAILDGTQSQRAKELALRKIPAAWSYLRTEILPPMRRVELLINYGEGNVVEQRTLIPQPKPTPKAAEPAPYQVVDETITGIIVEMPESRADFKKMTCKERKEVRKAAKMVKKEARIAEKLAKQELKDAAKIAKKDARQLRKMAKAEAKAEAKAAKKLR